VKQVRPGRANPEWFVGCKKSALEDEVFVRGYASGQQASLGNQTDHAIKTGYMRLADFFATQHKFLLLSGRHPYGQT